MSQEQRLAWGALVLIALLAAGPTACCQPGLCVDPTIDAGITVNTTDGGRSVQPTLSDIQEKIFTPACATSGCHDAPNAVVSGNLDLSTTAKSFEMVNAPTYDVPNLTRVVPGHPETSFLVVKLVEMWQPNAPPTYGAPMPEGASGALPADQLQAIQDWIADGAANN